ncbi:MAG TPA: beta-ketoacyl-[acyl-carrier-protein] synthase II [Firmicutes bacterium]|nr:beta-ketoacyl-[acyl-carrier-protein] synthase II [Bacillota bacterium]
MQRVFITGIGLVTPLGLGKDNVWTKLKAGVSAVGPITRFDVSDYPTRIAAEVTAFDPSDFMKKKEAKRTDRFVQFALAATELAIQDSQLDPKQVDTERASVYISSGIGGLETLAEQHEILLTKGPAKMPPLCIPMMIGNMAAGQVAIRYGFTGAANNIVSACASGGQAIGEALRSLQRGDADVILAGGTEASVNPIAVAGFCALRALSTRNDDPQTASRPFDLERDGFVIGEGAAVLVLETEAHLVRRGGTAYAELVGYGATNDASHVTAPHPEAKGATRAMQLALADAGLEPSEIDYINAHGTSTDMNDRLETLAIRNVFQAEAERLVVNSTKSMIGHLLGAAGAVELAVSALSIREGYVHPTINLKTKDPNFDLDYVANQGRAMPIRAALSNSLGFGGHNSTLAIRRA